MVVINNIYIHTYIGPPNRSALTKASEHDIHAKSLPMPLNIAEPFGLETTRIGGNSVKLRQGHSHVGCRAFKAPAIFLYIKKNTML